MRLHLLIQARVQTEDPAFFPGFPCPPVQELQLKQQCHSLILGLYRFGCNLSHTFHLSELGYLLLCKKEDPPAWISL